MNKYEFVSLLVAIAIVIFIVLVVVVEGSKSTFDNHKWEVTTHCVEYGETLWSIGRDECPYDVDIRDWIEEVLELNGMDNSRINEGQRISIYTLKGGN